MAFLNFTNRLLAKKKISRRIRRIAECFRHSDPIYSIFNPLNRRL
jgi:hypothetical protein